MPGTDAAPDVPARRTLAPRLSAGAGERARGGLRSLPPHRARLARLPVLTSQSIVYSIRSKRVSFPALAVH